MEKKNIIYTIVGTAVLFVVLYFVYLLINQPKNIVKTNETILYWGVGCPHCKIVEDFLDANPKIATKTALLKKEVYNDKVNARDLEEKAAICQLDTTNGIPVPFLYAKGQCFTGDKPIIDYFGKLAK